ncbi:CapA family protein [Candidatus Peregrinibacteria bacterium]|nr:CapA family protein [Candidatus Peregrinibacteria bacterium]
MRTELRSALHGAPSSPEEDTKKIPVQKFHIDPPEVHKNTLIFGGDVMLSRYVDVLMEKNNDYTAPFQDIAEYLSSADITFVNLESPFDRAPQHFSGGMVFGADVKSIEGLLFAGIDIVSLANNHIGDAGKEGVLYTMDMLKENDIRFVGAGENSESSLEPTFLVANDVVFGFLAYSDISPYYAATEEKPGYAMIPDADLLRERIQRTKEIADVVIVSVHTGSEYISRPHKDFVEFAHNAIDAGASLVIGHHPHVIQPVEEYNGGIVFYSLGNLVFDQLLSETKKGILAEVRFEDAKITGYEIKPIVIEKLWKPRFADDEERDEILKKTTW